MTKELPAGSGVQAPMKFIVVGAGAVGAVVGTLLASAGHDVQFWVRPHLRARLTALSIQRLKGAHVSIAPRGGAVTSV